MGRRTSFIRVYSDGMSRWIKKTFDKGGDGSLLSPGCTKSCKSSLIGVPSSRNKRLPGRVEEHIIEYHVGLKKYRSRREGMVRYHPLVGEILE